MKRTFHDSKMTPSSRHSPDQNPLVPSIAAFSPDALPSTKEHFRGLIAEARNAWLTKSTSMATRSCYRRDLELFLDFLGVPHSHLEHLVRVTPNQVAAWRDHLLARGLSNTAVVRKMTVLRSLFRYLQTCGYNGANPAHSDFVASPAVPRDGKTVALTPEECRRLLDSPDLTMPVGIRDRAMFAVLAYTGCRVGEIARLRVGDYKVSGGHKILEILGKGGKERRVPLHPEAFEALNQWIAAAEIGDDVSGPLFRPIVSARGKGLDGFLRESLTRRGIQYLVARTVLKLGVNADATVHSFRVTALTTARERGCDIVDLQSFAGHSDPKTTLSYIRNRDRLSSSPAYVLKY